RAFASLFKDEVAGMVFVDPLTEHIFSSMTQKAKEEAMAQQDAIKGSPALQAEWLFLRGEALNDFPELRAFGKPPNVPMMLLVAERNRPPGWAKALLGGYGTWMTEATEGRVIVTP